MKPALVRLAPIDWAALVNSYPMAQPSRAHSCIFLPGEYFAKSERNWATSGSDWSLKVSVVPEAYTLLRHGALKSVPTALLQTSIVDTLAFTVKPPRSMALHSFWLAGVSMASQMPSTPLDFMLTTSVSKVGGAKFSPWWEPPPS